MIKTNPSGVKNFFEKSKSTRRIPEERVQLLNKIAESIADTYKKQRNSLNLNFICTHNSRRSQIAQVWAFYAANYFKLNLHAYSGGTEVTAFHRNTVRTLKEVGFNFQVQEFSHQNPIYRISFNESNKHILGFSKTFDHVVNATPFVAITTCDHADENCPYIAEAIKRFHLPYTDPKFSDSTPEQSKVYLQTNEEIASEIFFIFQKINSLV